MQQRIEPTTPPSRALLAVVVRESSFWLESEAVAMMIDTATTALSVDHSATRHGSFHLRTLPRRASPVRRRAVALTRE